MTAQELKNSILMQAVQGKLVPQDPNDEPASVLLAKIRAEKEQMMKEGKIKKEPISEIYVDPSDNQHYEKVGKTVKCIEDKIPFQIPKEWCWSRIGNIAFVTKLAGFEYTKYIAPNLKSSGIPLFKGKNVQKGKLLYNFEGYISEAISNELVRSQINKKCLLTPYVGTIGNIAIFPGHFKAHLGSNVGKIEIIGGFILEEYVMYYFRSKEGYIELTKHKKSTAQESISIAAIREAFIPLPPINEQKRIVNKIKKILPYIKDYELKCERLKKLDDELPNKLKKSILQYAIEGKLVKQNPDDEPASELIKRIRLEKEKLIKSGKLKKDKNESFIYRGSDNSYYEKFQNGKEVCIDDEIPFEIPDNWIWIRLESICTYIFSGKSPKYSKIVNNNLVLGQKNNQDYGIDLSGIKYCTNEFIENYPKEFYLRKNDVLLNTLGGGTVGRSGIFSLEDNKYITDGHLFVFRSINDIISHYLLYYLKLNREAMEKSADGSTNQTFLKLNSVKKYLIPCPPFQEQARIVSTVRKLFNLL